MMRSLFSGVSGLKVHQTKMDVIGNNIANVNTVAYKSNSVTFSEVFYQTTQSASGPNAETGKGGTNAMQIGLGSNVGAISQNIETEGASQRTDNPFDLKISGQSFFIVENAGATYFTRAGNFTVDESGKLVTASGLAVMGWGTDAEGDILKSNVKPLYLKNPDDQYTPPEPTTANTITGNINKEDQAFAKTGGYTSFNLKFFDSLGYSYLATVNVSQDPDNNMIYNMTASNVLSDGKILEGYSFEISEPSLTFDNVTGKSTLENFTVNFTVPDGATPIEPITVDVSGLVSQGDETSIKVGYGDVEGNGKGKTVGSKTGVSIQQDGTISAYYSNGDVRSIGKIAVASFSNPAGLEKIGENLYQATLNSGIFNGIGEDISALGGKMSAGVLEMSNVDLSSEFTDMITTQRGFQANSRIITVSDTMLEELVNLKR
ncbi:MAG: flagellar hook protein FlgE [Lachnospiraceae bacterium]|nr:flagellar hook protein FlgE [Lachnospiraceae bacterium]